MRTLVIATRNAHKGGEMATLLSELLGSGWDIKTLADYPEFPEPEETGDTYAENARIKAEASALATGELCIADDAGLEVDALGGAPGVHSKRFEGEGRPFPEKMRIILSRIEGKPRTARFHCCVAISAAGMETKVFEAVKEGTIAGSPRGEAGFGYDPIFVLPELGKTYAELPPEEKNRISHRAMVLRMAADWLAGGADG